MCTARTCAYSATGSTDPDGDAFTYLWSWGDGPTTNTSATPSKTFLADGTYTVTLTLTDAWGNANTVTRDVTITEPATNVAPVPVINPVTCVVRTCTFYGVSSYEPNSDAFTYLWTFGSGTTTSTVVSPVFTYPADGTYTVTLTVTDAWGDFASITRDVVIGEPAGNLPPVPVINPVTCVSLTCTFSSVGTVDPNGDTMTYLWNFGDGTTSTTANPSKTYLAAGSYTVTLTVTDGWGDAAAATPRTVTITEPAGNLPPIPVIVEPVSCVGLVCTFSSAGSADPNGDGFTRVWSWGDGTPNTTSTTVTQAHTFVAGTYTVTLTLTDWWGDVATDTVQVTVA